MSDAKPLGQILTENGFISSEQLQVALEEQSRRNRAPLGQICVDRGWISREELQKLLKSYGKRLPLGEMLTHYNVISEEQLAEARQLQEATGIRIGEALSRLDHIDDSDLCEFLAAQFNLPMVTLATLRPSPGLKQLINPTFAAQKEVVPIAMESGRVTLAISDPTVLPQLHSVISAILYPVDIAIAPRSHVYTFYRKLYGREPGTDLGKRTSSTARLGLDDAPATVSSEEADSVWSDMVPEDESVSLGTVGGGNIDVLETDAIVDSTESSYGRSSGDSPVVQTLVQTIVSRALALRSSDIHFEKGANGAALRMRIDGVLHRYRLDDLDAAFQGNYRSIMARIKVLAQMDITEKRRPQDGSFRMLIRREGQLSNVDFRISTVPGRYGEGMVIRLLDQRRAPVSLDALGMTPVVRDGILNALRRPSGIFLVTGPTGSGKSSTLYAAIRTVVTPKIKILTAEDPIEYTHPGIFQTEVNADIGNTFARYLRAFLRQDPDIIMVGEIRDAETAAMAMRASQTGHLLLSTLHSINSTSAIQRLLDLDLEPNSVASSLNGILAQRLMRLNCKSCLEPEEPDAKILADWFHGDLPEVEWQRGVGCTRCNYTGFSGRAAVTELWTPTPENEMLINKRTPSDELREIVLKDTASLAEDALLKAVRGETTLEEALRVVPYEDVRRVRDAGPHRVLATLASIEKHESEKQAPKQTSETPVEPVEDRRRKPRRKRA